MMLLVLKRSLLLPVMLDGGKLSYYRVIRVMENLLL